MLITDIIYIIINLWQIPETLMLPNVAVEIVFYLHYAKKNNNFN